MYYIELPKGTFGGYCFSMNERCYTAFPEEKELLLDDGLPFKITDIKKNQPIPHGPHKGKKITEIYFQQCLPEMI